MKSFSEKYLLPTDTRQFDLSSYDLLKALAIILMVIDHIGFFFVSTGISGLQNIVDPEWFRTFGRLCVPIFFFLIGYAKSREIPTRWLIGALIVDAVAGVVLGATLPLCILFSLIFCRLVIDWVFDFLKIHAIYRLMILLLLIFFVPVSDMVFEYGTLGLLWAMVGYCIRNREKVEPEFGRLFPLALTAIVVMAFVIFQSMRFALSDMQSLVLAFGTVAITYTLWHFKPSVYAHTGSHPYAPLVRFMGRYTFEIYVVHYTLFVLIFALFKPFMSL